ncbi:hypothetical protein CDCA_CDCA18G4545 [Cyanidium caldarium]|uniref:Uncharacterized protein n=1 Tax=Cyanidium caldarium TaxID=2771 RepID=A0AAV9J1R6_CYACA|nr:hypothetical protein CDCA_CDCA18G4545 [Cyanidium caldarium]
MALFGVRRIELELFKMGLYISLPIAAVVLFGSHERSMLERAIQTFRYVQYPPEGPRPPTGVEMLARAREAQEQRRPPPPAREGASAERKQPHEREAQQ